MCGGLGGAHGAAESSPGRSASSALPPSSSLRGFLAGPGDDNGYLQAGGQPMRMCTTHTWYNKGQLFILMQHP